MDIKLLPGEMNETPKPQDDLKEDEEEKRGRECICVWVIVREGEFVIVEERERGGG